MNHSLTNALHKIFENPSSFSNFQEELSPLVASGELFSVGKDKTLMFQNDPVDYIEPLQILGLVEYLNQIPY